MNLVPRKPSLTLVFQVVLKLLTITGTLAIGIVLWSIYFEAPLLRYQNLPFPVETAVEQGRTVPIVIERCNNSKTERVYLSSRNLRQVETGKIVILANSTMTLAPGCHRDTSRAITIPRETPIGMYIIEGEATIRGTIKEHHIEWYTEPFEVIPLKGLTKQLDDDNELERLRGKTQKELGP